MTLVLGWQEASRSSHESNSLFVQLWCKLGAFPSSTRNTWWRSWEAARISIYKVDVSYELVVSLFIYPLSSYSCYINLSHFTVFCSKSGHLYKSGASVGLEFTGKCKRFPNTVLGHTFLEYLKQVDGNHKAQNAAVEMIFQVKSLPASLHSSMSPCLNQ